MFEKMCGNCIAAIRSRGEKIFTGSEIDYDEYIDEHGTAPVCDLCEDEDVALYEVIIP